jgi:pyruvate/2-oxoglutarate dehydrogenase complex dihydrolipoamide dehydrogenase (E3) component
MLAHLAPRTVLDRGTGRILGAEIPDIEGGEVMSVIEAAMIEAAMMGRLPYTALRDGFFAHPTFAESLNNLFYCEEPFAKKQGRDDFSPVLSLGSA